MGYIRTDLGGAWTGPHRRVHLQPRAALVEGGELGLVEVAAHRQQHIQPQPAVTFGEHGAGVCSGGRFTPRR
jgi:hypothetical protein